jgi:hypothetical protein
MRYLGVDVTGSGRAWDWILIDDDVRVPRHARGGERELLEFVSHSAPNVIAVDAPSKRNCGLMRQPSVRRELLGSRADERSKGGGALVYDDCRVSEAELGVRNIKCYFTSGTRSLPDWVGAGLKLYDSLAELGYMLWDTPGPVSTIGSGVDRIAIEVYPHACFVVKLGWIPQLKISLGGCLERIACLREWGRELNVPIGGGYEQILQELSGLDWERILTSGAPASISHDKLDALAAALTAKQSAGEPPVSFAVGHKADGVLVLPARPAATYRSLASAPRASGETG